MIEDAIEIRTADGTADGFLYRADDGRPRPGVIHLTDIRSEERRVGKECRL